MTPSHTPESFAAWLRGFMDAIDGVPSAAQVERICGELAKVAAPDKTEQAKPEPVVLGKELQKFLDGMQKYQPPAYPIYPTTPHLPTWPPAPSPWNPLNPWLGGGTWC